jgi:hypothetical protein
MDAAQVTRLQRRFVPPPGLGVSTPRDVRLTGAGRATAGLAVLFAVGALVAFLGLFTEARRQADSRLALMASLPAAALAGVGAILLTGIARQRSLLMNGRAAAAVVTALRKERNSEGGHHQVMTYEFRLLTGATRTGTRQAPRKPPAIGAVICIVYDPERPSRNRLYPFSLVRV